MIKGKQVQRTTVLCLVLLLIGSATGCVMSMRPASEIDETGEIRVDVAVGDVVRVLTKYGQRPTFEVTGMDTNGLVGDGRSIPYDDMVFVERLTVSTGESMVASLLIASGAVFLEALDDLADR